MFNVCDYWFNKDQNRLRDIRPDALAQMLNLANVRPGGRYLAVDDASGVVISAILDRLGGVYMLGTHQWDPAQNIHLCRTRTSHHHMRRRLTSSIPSHGPHELP